MIRRLILLLFSLSALLGSSAAAWATLLTRDENLRGYVDAAQTADLPYRVPRLGVNAELTQYDSEQLEQQLDLMQAAGIHWVRQFARWNEIEPERGQFDWQQWDQITAAFENRTDLQLVVVLMNTPVWAHSGEITSVTAPPLLVNDYANFAAAFAERYSQAVDYYQIWDEPNLTAAWGDSQPLSRRVCCLASNRL